MSQLFGCAYYPAYLSTHNKINIKYQKGLGMKKTYSYSRLIIHIFLISVCSLASISTRADTDNVIQKLPSISVDAILPDDLRYTPGAASSLYAEEIERLRPYTIHDALDFTPGVKTIDDDVLSRRSGIGVRGAPSRRSRKTLLMEDGTPINASTYLDQSGHYTPPMDRLESVDVLKGAGHVLYGPLNNHGIVNFRNKRPTLTSQTDIDISGGQNDTLKAHIMHRNTVGSVGYVLSYTGLNADGVFDTENTRFDDFYGALTWDINNRHRVDMSFLYYRERSDGYDESNLLPAEYARNPFTKANRLVRFGGNTTATGWGQEFNNFSVEYFKTDLQHDFQINERLSMSSRLFVTDMERPRFTVDPEDIEFDPNSPVLDFDAGGGTPFISGVQGEMVGRERLYRTFGIESRMELTDVKLFDLDHTFQWGLRFERHLADDRRRQGGVGEVLDIDNRGAVSRDVELQAWASSFFVQDAISFSDWVVTPGVRFEYYEQKRHREPFIDGSGAVQDLGNIERNTHQALILPSISLLYSGFDQTQVFANVGRGYTPGFARTAEEDDFPLEAETGINSQLGLRTTAMQGVTFETAAFYNIITDTIVQQPFTTDFQNVFINSADSESYGIDIGLRVDSNAYTNSPYNWYGMLAYNYTRAEFTEGQIDGNRVPEIPLHTGSFTLGLQHDNGWDVSATVSHFGSFFTDVANTRALTVADEDGEILAAGDDLEIREPVVLGEVSSHTLLSARASYTPRTMDNVTFWVQGRNLTDKLYITDLANGIRPGAERTIVGGFSLQF